MDLRQLWEKIDACFSSICYFLWNFAKNAIRISENFEEKPRALLIPITELFRTFSGKYNILANTHIVDISFIFLDHNTLPECLVSFTQTIITHFQLKYSILFSVQAYKIFSYGFMEQNIDQLRVIRLTQNSISFIRNSFKP